MKNPAPTFSALPRVIACPASQVLEHTRDVTESEAASKGLVIHDYLKNVSLFGRDEALARVPWEHREVCEQLRLDELPVDPEKYAVEVAYAYDWSRDTARELDRGVSHRNYQCGPTEIAGRADVVGAGEDFVVIIDWKTGYRWLGEAAQSWQLRANALAAARAMGKTRAKVAFARLMESGRAYFLWAELGPMDLDETAVTIAETMELIQEGAKAINVIDMVEKHLALGPHCVYCPAYLRCPAQVTLLRELVAEATQPVTELVLTPEMAPKLHERLMLVEDLVSRLRGNLKTYAKGSPVPIGDGYVYGETAVEKEKFDPIKGALVLAKLFDEKAAEDCVESDPVLTKASLDRGLRKLQDRLAEKERIGTLRDRALEALRAGGAARTEQEKQVRVHRPKVEEAA